MQATSQPVEFTADPDHRAALIHCGVCRVCRWSDPRVPSCIYQGPFDGYLDLDGQIVRIALDQHSLSAEPSRHAAHSP